MWDAPIMRWLVIPAIFVAVGPPAGAVVVMVFPVGAGLTSPGLIAGTLMVLPLFLVFSYLFGGAQALLTGLVAAATLRRGGRVRAAPTLGAALAIGALFAWGAAVAEETAAERRMDVLLNGSVLLLIHLAGGLAGLAVCRWVERGGEAPCVSPTPRVRPPPSRAARSRGRCRRSG